MNGKIIDYDNQIKLTKESLKKDIKHTKEMYAKVISDLEEKKRLQDEEIAYQKRLKYANGKNGKYRVATDKMMEYASAIQNASLTYEAEKLFHDLPKNVIRIEEYAKDFPKCELDDFDLIKSYISKFVNDAQTIWKANSTAYKIQKQHDWENSWAYKEEQERKKLEKKLEEDDRRREEYELSHRIYDGTGGYWCTGFGSNNMYVDKFGES